MAADNEPVDVEPVKDSVRAVTEVGLEAEDVYIRRVKAEVTRSKATAAIWVTVILTIGLVLSLPCYVVTVLCIESAKIEVVASVFAEWYRVVTPILAAAVGALLGVSLSSSSEK